MCPQAEGRARRRIGRRRIPQISQGVPNEWCAVCGLCEREGLIRRPVTVCELYGLPPTVVGCGCHPSARSSPIGSRCPPLRGGAEAPWFARCPSGVTVAGRAGWRGRAQLSRARRLVVRQSTRGTRGRAASAPGGLGFGTISTQYLAVLFITTTTTVLLCSYYTAYCTMCSY